MECGESSPLCFLRRQFEDFEIANYQARPHISAPVAVRLAEGSHPFALNYRERGSVWSAASPRRFSF